MRAPDRQASRVSHHLTIVRKCITTHAGLTRPQCERLTAKHHVYLTMDGRISMAGLNARGAEYLAAAIADVVANA